MLSATQANRRFGSLLLLRFPFAFGFVVACSAAVQPPPPRSTSAPAAPDILVVGGTPAGIAAAVNAARAHRRVMLIEENAVVGGLVAGGINNTDFTSFESLGGTWREFMNRVKAHYASTYGEDSEPVRECLDGAFYEPHVARKVLEDMLAGAGVVVKTKLRLVSADMGPELDGKRRIKALTFQNLETQRSERHSAEVFIDSTYEGDLMAMAGVAYSLGAEAQSTYGESLAPANANPHVMAYNYRVTVSEDPVNQIPFYKPERYDPEAFPRILELFRKGTAPWPQSVVQLTRLPNRKAGLNDHPVAKAESFMLYQESDGWPEGSADQRARLRDLARHRAEALFYFLSHDERLPANVVKEMSRWGYAKDEHADTGNFSSWLYVREGRRMKGQYVFTQKDAMPAPDSVRAPAHAFAVAMGDYPFNSHGTHLDPEGNEAGKLFHAARPFQVPYGTMLPQNVRGLLVPVAVSASRVGFSALRMEPTWTALGQAAGLAAAMAVEDHIDVELVDVTQLQGWLHELKAMTFYASDVPPHSPYFKAVQFLGNRGFFQHLYPPDAPGDAGNKLPWKEWIQYTEAFLSHDIQPDTPLSKELAAEWQAKARDLDPQRPFQVVSHSNLTRGALLLRLFEHLSIDGKRRI